MTRDDKFTILALLILVSVVLFSGLHVFWLGPLHRAERRDAVPLADRPSVDDPSADRVITQHEDGEGFTFSSNWPAELAVCVTYRLADSEAVGCFTLGELVSAAHLAVSPRPQETP